MYIVLSVLLSNVQSLLSIFHYIFHVCTIVSHLSTNPFVLF
jgi:hypothetical protein